MHHAQRPEFREPRRNLRRSDQGGGRDRRRRARLQIHAEVGGILVAHETSSLIKDTILTEEQDPVSVKGFTDPVRVYRVVGIYDELEKAGQIIREERDGFRLLVDLTKGTRPGQSRLSKTRLPG
jgi:hypothetical protein